MTEKELILTSILGLSRSELYLESIILNETEKNRFESLIEKRKNGEPLQYLLGYTEFMGLKFKVDSRALIPRPETEILVEETINCVKELNYSVRNVLDIGTGSGNISVSVAKLLTQTEITASDICTEALGLARENAILNKVDHRVEFINGDFLNNWQLIKKSNFYPPSQKTTSLPADECEEKVASAGFSLMDKPETSQRITPTSMPKLSKKILAYLRPFLQRFRKVYPFWITSRGNIGTTGLPVGLHSSAKPAEALLC